LSRFSPKHGAATGGAPKAAKARPTRGPATRWQFGRAERRLLLVVLALVVVAAIGAHFALNQASAWRSAASKDQAEATQDDAVWHLGLSVRAHRSSWEARLASAEAALPTTEDQPGFVTDMAALTGSCGAVWSSSSWQGGPAPSGPSSAAGPGQSWSVALAVSGPQQVVDCVLKRLGRLPRAATVTSVALNYEGASMVQASISLDVYARGAAR
jgi:hypothetical protein